MSKDRDSKTLNHVHRVAQAIARTDPLDLFRVAEKHHGPIEPEDFFITGFDGVPVLDESGNVMPRNFDDEQEPD